MRKFIFLILSMSSFTFAGIEQAPKNFEMKGKKATWIDIKSAHYELVYNTISKSVTVKTTFEFEMPSKGYPLFDSIPTPSNIELNNKSVTQSLVATPEGASRVRMINREVSSGLHQLQMSTKLSAGVYFHRDTRRLNWGNVSSAFFIRDLKDRMMLEKYLPTNLEYDSYKMTMDVEVKGTKRFHSLFANGKVTKIKENKYHVSYPDYYTCSSVFFHLVPINKFVRWYFDFTSIDGRKIPVTIYSKFRFYNHFLKKKALPVLRELENDYGPWPHEQLIIYGTGIRGGMEYAGATETSIVSLGHELQHSYFAKGIHPANGNAGWMDEAIASWRDRGHQSIEKPFYESAGLSAHSPYTRKTDKRSYEYGRSFMAYIDYELKKIGKDGLKDFLRIYFQKRKFSTVTTTDFLNDLEDYAQMSFKNDFRQYVWGQEAKHLKENVFDVEENPHHPEITEDQLKSIL